MFAQRLAAMPADLAHDPWPETRVLYRRILDVLDERVARDSEDLKTGELFEWLDGRVRDEINVVLGFWMPPSLWTAFAEVFPITSCRDLRPPSSFARVMVTVGGPGGSTRSTVVDSVSAA